MSGALVSFSKDRTVAESFAASNGPYRIIYRIDRHRSARDIFPAAEKISPKLAAQQEVLFLGRTEFVKAAKIERIEGTTVIVRLQEVSNE